MTIPYEHLIIAEQAIRIKALEVENGALREALQAQPKEAPPIEE